MPTLKQFIIPLLIFLFSSCNPKSDYPYAIKDFDERLQIHLTKMVEEGIVMGSNSALQKIATDSDLERLSSSEHPILRAAAFREMLDRKSFNHFDIILNHLYDTALVFTDAGEFGIWDRTVSDDILQEAGWKTQEEKNKTIDQVLAKHNYLRSAYIILSKLEPQHKYYPIIKDMATRSRQLEPYSGNELGFGDIEYALYGLAKFRKKEDVQLIKNQLIRHVWRLSNVSFGLMKEYPDTAYLDVLQKYHRRQFYEFSGNRPGGFSGVIADRASPEDFIAALAVQQNERSAKLLDTMLNRLPLVTCMPDKKSIIIQIVREIWEHPCPAYAELREKVKLKAEEDLKWQNSFSLDTTPIAVDTTDRLIYW